MAADPFDLTAPEGVPLTEAQEGLWRFQAMDPDNPILNAGQYLEILGPLDVAAFAEAVRGMIAETEALRLRFRETPQGPRQRLAAEFPAMAVSDHSRAPDPEAAALAMMRADSDKPLDLARDAAAAFHLHLLGPERAFWYERVHHLCLDGYGVALITDRAAERYAALKGGPAAGPDFGPLRLALEADAEYRASARRAQDAAWGREAMAGAPEALGMKPGRAVSGHGFHRATRLLPPEFLARLRDFARNQNATWPDLVTALTGAYVQRFTGGPEAVLGVPFMARLGGSLARLPCMAMNVPPLRMIPDEEAVLGDWLKGVSKSLIALRRHGRYRAEALRRDLGRIGGGRRLHGPLINIQPFDSAPKMPGLETRLHILSAGAVEDFTFSFRGDAHEGAIFEADSNPALYSAEETEAHADRFLAFLEGALKAERLADLPTASPAEARRFLVEANATEHPFPDQATLIGLILEKLRERPQAEALRFEGESLTNAELDARTGALAAKLKELGAGPDRVVAVALPRSTELIVALLAIQRAGAAYLPIDLEHPPARRKRVLDLAAPVLTLRRAEDAEAFAGFPALTPDQWPRTGEAPPPAAGPENLAYVIFTSGSTGEPKGVMIEHRAIVNRLIWMREYYGFAPGERILQKTPAVFDVSVWEFFLAFLSGETLVVAPPGAHRDPSALARIIRDERIDTLHFTPSMLSAFLAAPESLGLKVKRVFCSGEELTADQRERFHARISGELHNLYGPTEAAVDVTFWPATPEDHSSPVPIGFPVWNTRLYALDSRLRPLPAGLAGDLYLGGVQLARGYLGRPDLTAERFPPDPFRPGERIYATGDLARWRPDGAMEFLGRSDHQVKIRGQRIELGEIEAAILGTGLAREAAVIAREDQPGVKRLTAYVVPATGYEAEQLRAALAASLTPAMIPSHLLALPALPLNVNGKLDRAALPAPALEEGGPSRPATPEEAKLAGLVAEVLELPHAPGPESDFFRLGGDSLLAMRLALRIREVFGKDPGVGAIFDSASLAEIAARVLAAEGPAEGLEPLLLLAKGDPEAPPIFLAHPAGGLGWGYRALAKALAPARSVYALQAPSLTGAAPFASLDALAEDYAARVAEAVPQGPIHLAGWSVGGVIVQAMAAKLAERGREVGLAALLDSYPAEVWRGRPEPSEAEALRAFVAIAGLDPTEAPPLANRAELLAYLREKGGGPMTLLPPEVLEGVVKVALGANALVRGHEHRPFPGRLTHIRAGLDHQKDPGLQADLWLAHCAALEKLEAPFLHPQLVSPAAVAVIAPLLAERLAQFDQETV
ncbi:non-ribosomal peptide synthetase [Neomegalonema perideroedes]|uniref:non-ribosomal peptide synthetase n=1 Tax=Neomegalonema perideroedes TaxID=217219 RepID=UPI000377CCB5|nr:non-ribosomal peptide synthetase [Neomegalonema perideroedes]